MENQIAQQRELTTVENEIILLKKQAQQVVLSYIIEIGKRLVEAKALVPHGEWSEWLENKVEFSIRTAQNYMKIFDEYGTDQISFFGNTHPVADLEYSKALALIAIPREERDEFIEKNDVENMSKRELENAIKERDEALKKAELADEIKEQLEIAQAKAEKAEHEAAANAERVKSLNQEIIEKRTELDKAKESAKKAKSKLKELKDNPVIPQETMDKLKAEAQQAAAESLAVEIEAKTKELSEQLKAAELAKSRAEEKARKAAEQVTALEKKIQMSSPEITEFNRLFMQAQEDMGKLIAQLDKVKTSNPELAEKLRKAVSAFVGQYAEV